MAVSSPISFSQALDNYYKLQNKYQEKYEKEKKKLIKNDALTIPEKRARLQNFERSCVACGKSGGTIFKQEKNMLIAYCGHGSNQCKLDIKLQRANYKNIHNQISSLNKVITSNKISTIRSKYDLLFGFEQEAAVLETFNKLKAELIEEVKKYQVVYDKYLSIITEKTPTLQNDQLLILVNEFKELISRYNSTNNPAQLKDAIELYINSIEVINKKIRDTKYSYNGFYIDEKDNTKHLVQDVFTLAELVTPTINSENKVLSYVL